MRHVPDLLSEGSDGAVTLWDCRAPDRQDDGFRDVAQLTRAACSAVGWEYQVFGGWERSRRMNLLWLHAYRRPEVWHERAARAVFDIAEVTGSAIGDVQARGDSDGLVLSTMWHLIWTGRLHCDLDAPLTSQSPIGKPI